MIMKYYQILITYKRLKKKIFIFNNIMRTLYYYNNFRTFNIIAVSVFILFLVANAGIYFIFEIIFTSILILESGNLGFIFGIFFFGNKLISIFNKINEISNIP